MTPPELPQRPRTPTMVDRGGPSRTTEHCNCDAPTTHRRRRREHRRRDNRIASAAAGPSNRSHTNAITGIHQRSVGCLLWILVALAGLSGAVQATRIADPVRPAASAPAAAAAATEQTGKFRLTHSHFVLYRNRGGGWGGV